MTKKSLQAELEQHIYKSEDAFEAARSILRSRRIKVTWAKEPKRNHER
jgi:hypothetical protein